MERNISSTGFMEEALQYFFLRNTDRELMNIRESTSSSRFFFGSRQDYQIMSQDQVEFLLYQIKNEQ